MKMKTEELIRMLKYIKRNENRGTHNVATRNNKSTDVPNLLNRGTRTKDRQIDGNENRGTYKGKTHKIKQKQRHSYAATRNTRARMYHKIGIIR